VAWKIRGTTTANWRHGHPTTSKPEAADARKKCNWSAERKSGHAENEPSPIDRRGRFSCSSK
jgi:hypothetical protein